MQVSRETGYDDLQKLMLKEMASMVAPGVLTSQQEPGELRIRLIDPAADQADPNHYLQPEVVFFFIFFPRVPQDCLLSGQKCQYDFSLIQFLLFTVRASSFYRRSRTSSGIVRRKSWSTSS